MIRPSQRIGVWGVLFLFSLVEANDPMGTKGTILPLAPDRIESVLQGLTLEEKIGMLHGATLFTTGGVDRIGLPGLKMADGPTGVREELEPDSWRPLGLTSDSATFFPAGPALAATWNRDLARRYGEALGEEARARDKDILLAPSVNLIRTPLSGRNFEFFTEDPFLNAEMTTAYIVGLQSKDVAACVKHYAANNQERDRHRIDVRMDERTLREVYLPAFQAAIERAGVLAVMGAYNRFRGDYCCENAYLLNRILKGEWGFPGVVISDWGATHSAGRSALAGLDIEMGSRKPWFGEPLLEAVRRGEVPDSVIDDKVRRILYVLSRIRKGDPNRCPGRLATPDHFQTAYDVASEAIVLLKNTDGLLPLDLSRIRRLAVIGENAVHRHAREGNGAGVKAKKEVTPLEGLRQRLGGTVEISYAPGYRVAFDEIETGGWWRRRVPSYAADSVLIQEAVDMAKDADAALIIGGSNRLVEDEGRDRADIRIPFGQEALIRAVTAVQPRTVVVWIASAPYDFRALLPDISALVWAWFNGSEAGTALADVLCGKVNPSGKLPFTLPARLEDSPAHALGAYPGDGETVAYTEGLLVGYRWFDTRRIEPLFCFGHGLSYTTFSYEAFWTDREEYGSDDTLCVFVSVRNTGTWPGRETVQVYIHALDSPVFRPEQELKGFTKVSVAPGAAALAKIAIPALALAYYDADRQAWILPPGHYELRVGASSRDIRGRIEIRIGSESGGPRRRSTK